MSDIGPDTQVERNPEMVDAEVDGEVIMMSIEQGEYYGMDTTGSRIWALLETSMSFSTLCQKLMDEYDVEEATCQTEVTHFLSDMAERNIVTLQG